MKKLYKIFIFHVRPNHKLAKPNDLKRLKLRSVASILVSKVFDIGLNNVSAVTSSDDSLL